MPKNCLSLPHALSSMTAIRDTLGTRRPAVFLDYDGTLTPIVGQPEHAVLGAGMRSVLEALGSICPLAIVSGRALEDIRSLVGIDGIFYAGNHGFEIEGPGEPPVQFRIGGEFRAALDSAHRALRAAVQPVQGARVEDKGYSLTVHSRQVADHAARDLESVVDRVVQEHPGLIKHSGKRVRELRPDLDWHKGRAVTWLLDRMTESGVDLAPIFVGDDVTDEDAFRAVSERGVGVVVCVEEKPTRASFRLDDTHQVETFVRALASWEL